MRLTIQESPQLNLLVNCGQGDTSLRVGVAPGRVTRLHWRAGGSTGVSIGLRGPKGDTGEIGPAGAAAVTMQFAESLTWNLTHNLGRRPAVSLFTAGGMNFFAEVLHISENQATVTFDTPIAGFAVIT